ncbi:hypothetical protein HanXRQr2_Chr07g0310931 [Helianthus annuus]|uniref:Uncharacterized protein n=1 Tax=Helianthus annuus TaxID=4232 RepID=A0A9K3INT7_HELAN|nr:hypothetical protein HanXRQr2_Chr07g0310931 [Helianthus annuus]
MNKCPDQLIQSVDLYEYKTNMNKYRKKQPDLQSLISQLRSHQQHQQIGTIRHKKYKG